MFLQCRSELVPAFVRLLRDNEAEVRVAAASKLSAFCKILAGEAVIAALLPCVKELSTDGSQVSMNHWPCQNQNSPRQISCMLIGCPIEMPSW